MKPGSESAAAQRAPEKDEFVSRKLIRPTLPMPEPKQDAANGTVASERVPRNDRPRAERKSSHAPEQTFAENFYFQKQLQNKTPLTVVLKNGESVIGTIEWYDRNCIKLNRVGKSNLVLYKPAIRYIYKSSEDTRGLK